MVNDLFTQANSVVPISSENNVVRRLVKTPTAGKIMYLLLVLSHILAFNACDKGITEKKYAIKINNETVYSIDLYLALGGKYGSRFPDTSLPLNTN